MNTSIASRFMLGPDWMRFAADSEYCAAKFAELSKMNLRTLERLYQKNFQVTPQEWLDHLRQLEAENLARAGARTKEIAYQLGYKQPSHFCRQFKRGHGVPLKVWKKKNGNA